MKLVIEWNKEKYNTNKFAHKLCKNNIMYSIPHTQNMRCLLKLILNFEL